MADVQTVFITLTKQACITCGVVFGVDSEYDRRLRETHKNFVCPNGHSQHYTGTTEAEKLRAQLEAKERDLIGMQNSRDYHARKLDEERRSKIAIKGHLTRSHAKLDRVKHGVCPCCNRTFGDVARHMQTKHPTYQPAKQ